MIGIKQENEPIRFSFLIPLNNYMESYKWNSKIELNNTPLILRNTVIGLITCCERVPEGLLVQGVCNSKLELALELIKEKTGDVLIYTTITERKK